MAVPEDVDVQVEPIQTVRPLRQPTLSIDKHIFELPLAPRKLGARTKKRNDAIRAFASISLLVVAAMFAYLGFMVILASQSTSYASDCEEATSVGVERYFQINIRLPASFSYSNVRLIDISWDIVIGQGGRFVHAWILYRTVIAPNLGRIMERIGVPYVMYVDLSFQPATAQALVTLAKSFVKVRGWRVITSMAWYMLAIGYVLTFSTVWSASSGYLNPTVRYYRMPDNSYISSSQTELLSLCWTHDDPRISQIVPNVTSSPILAQLNTAGLDLVADKKGNKTFPVVTKSGNWNNFPYNFDLPLEGDAYNENFMSLAFYSVTQNEILSNLNYTYWRITGEDTGVYEPPDSKTSPFQIRRLNNSLSQYETKGLYPQIRGWQYSTAPSDTQSLNATFNSSWGELNNTWAPTYYSNLFTYGATDYQFTNTTGWETTFTLNESIALGPGVLPYNSTLVFNGTVHQLPAPFVQFGKSCPHVVGVGGPCLCYKGEPIPYSLDDDVVICASESGYVWGFSGTMLGIGLLLECAWILGCWGVWLDSHLNSDLSLMGRGGSGSVRSAFDLVEAARRELGDDLSSYSDDELREALKRCGLIGYEIKEDKLGTNVSVVPRDMNLRRRGRRRDSEDTLPVEDL